MATNLLQLPDFATPAAAALRNFFFGAPRILASFTWVRFGWFMGFILVLAEWSWAGILLSPKTMSFDEHVYYFLAILQRNLIHYAPIYFLVSLADGLGLKGAARKTALAVALVVGVSVAMPLRCALNPGLRYYVYSKPVALCKVVPWWRAYLEYPYAVMNPLLVAGMVMIFYFGRRRDLELGGALRSALAAQAESRRQRIESDLQAMQARVNPEFLFAELAEVRGRYETDATAGEARLDELIAVLRRKAQPELAHGAA